MDLEERPSNRIGLNDSKLCSDNVFLDGEGPDGLFQGGGGGIGFMMISDGDLWRR